MDKQKILIQIKEEMKHTLDLLGFENRKSVVEKMKKYDTFLEALEELPEFEMIIPETEEGLTRKLKEAIVLEKGEINVVDEPLGEELYVFERRVRGGIVIGMDEGQDYLIPEKMVRDIGLEQGDIVRNVGKKTIVDKMNSNNTRNHYRLEIAKKVGGIMNGRVEYRYCLVKEDEEGCLYVDFGNGEEIKVAGEATRLYIQERDINQFNLEEEDLIDIAFAEERPMQSVRVIYKEENFGELNSSSENRSIVRRKVNKSVDSNEKTPKDYGVLDKTLFEGKKLLMVGGGTRHPDFKQALESLGAEFIGANGSEQTTRIESMITNADAVVINILECNHPISIYSVSAAKKHGVAYGIAKRNGIQTVVKIFEEVLMKKKEDVENNVWS